MIDEWANTPWASTTVVEHAPRIRVLPKAATGWEQFAYSGAAMNSVLSKSPLRRMREEQALYWSHPWVRVAERAVTRRVAGLPWHLEDGEQDEVDDTSDPRLREVRQRLEKPQSALPPRERQPGIDSWTNLTNITSRHAGLCGMTHWYFDQMDAAGQPRAILYVNPARLYPVTTSSGQLVAWSLDPKDDWGRGGTVLSLEEILTFYLEPPDFGAIATGLVHAAWLKAQITQSGDAHYLNVLYSGGRLAGIVAPSEGGMTDEQYAVATRELRSANEAQDSARRVTILRGPVDFHETAGNPTELDLSGYAAMTRSDILTIWGVPDTTEGIPAPAGLNSGGTRDFDEAALMQGAVHDRVRVIRDTVQFGLLDRYDPAPQLVIEEPTFDDETPKYKLAETAKDQPLLRNERRAILGLDPLPEYGPDGEPLGLAIDLPVMLTVVGQGEEPERLTQGRFGNAPQPEPINVTPPAPPLLQSGAPAKAAPLARESMMRRFEPGVRKAVAAFLRSQSAEIADKVRTRGDHLARKPSDRDVWWDAKRWDRELMAALKSGLAGIAAQVTGKVEARFGSPAKASFATSVVEAILQTVGRRVTGINETTRDLIAALIGQGFADGLSPLEVARTIENAASFDLARAELIARTETAQVYNEAAIRSYGEYGVTEVEAIDGDEDPECAARNGQTYSIEDALAIEDHPNGTLDWLPVV